MVIDRLQVEIEGFLGKRKWWGLSWNNKTGDFLQELC